MAMYGQLAQYCAMLDTAKQNFEYQVFGEARIKIISDEVVAVFQRGSGDLVGIRRLDTYGEDR